MSLPPSDALVIHAFTGNFSVADCIRFWISVVDHDRAGFASANAMKSVLTLYKRVIGGSVGRSFRLVKADNAVTCVTAITKKRK